MSGYRESRRKFLKLLGTVAVASQVNGLIKDAWSSEIPDVDEMDRVFIANEDSNTISVIDPGRNAVEATINLTSFDEDPRPPFRYVTGGIMPTHAAMIHKPLYHGCIDAHGVVPSPDGKMLATSGRGSSNVYLIDTVRKKVIGNVPNPFVSATTNSERISSGIVVGREPHEPTFTRNGKELWVAVRGEDRIVILDVEKAVSQAGGAGEKAIVKSLGTVNGPAQVWFNTAGTLAFVISQKVAKVDILKVNQDANGHSNPEQLAVIDISGQDSAGFTPFLKTSPDGKEVWFSHKLS
ncbi:MAG: YncE family protein, partial [Nitrospirota bacterium]